jgi:colicin import membrane protein
MAERIPVIFKAAWKGYNPGERAGFTAKKVAELVAIDAVHKPKGLNAALKAADDADLSKKRELQAQHAEDRKAEAAAEKERAKQEKADKAAADKEAKAKAKAKASKASSKASKR